MPSFQPDQQGAKHPETLDLCWKNHSRRSHTVRSGPLLGGVGTTYGREAKLSETELREKKLQAEIALKESQTELHQLRTAIANGKYISIEEAQADYTKFFAVLKRFCSGLPSRVVGMIGSRISPVESRELEKDLNKEINDILRTFVLAATVKDGDGG